MEQFYDKVSASADYIRQHAPLAPTVGIILCSGLGGLVDAMTDKTVIPYHPIGLLEPESCVGCATCAIMCPDGVISVYTE